MSSATGDPTTNLTLGQCFVGGTQMTKQRKKGLQLAREARPDTKMWLWTRDRQGVKILIGQQAKKSKLWVARFHDEIYPCGLNYSMHSRLKIADFHLRSLLWIPHQETNHQALAFSR